MNKRLRQKMILDIIESIETETQEDLAQELQKKGILVTQATLSRDIRELNLIKTAGKYKKHKYEETYICTAGIIITFIVQ